MQLARLQVDVVPAQRHKLAGTQPVAIGQQDRRSVPMTPTVLAGGVHQLLDLALREVVPRPRRSDCYILWRWRLRQSLQIFQHLPPFHKSTVTNHTGSVTVCRGKTDQSSSLSRNRHRIGRLLPLLSPTPGTVIDHLDRRGAALHTAPSISCRCARRAGRSSVAQAFALSTRLQSFAELSPALIAVIGRVHATDAGHARRPLLLLRQGRSSLLEIVAATTTAS
jgi:hypothetical protein